MAGHLGGGSRAGSISEGVPLMVGQEQTENHAQLEESSLATLARRSTKRNRSFRSKKALAELQEVLGSRRPSCDSNMDQQQQQSQSQLQQHQNRGDQQHLHPNSSFNASSNINHRRSPSLRRSNSPNRSPSPRRRYHHTSSHHLHHDIGFSDTVSNVVEIVKHHEHHRSHSNRRFMRGSWSASTSPARSPSPTQRHYNNPIRYRDASRSSRSRYGYGTSQRSRTPSPTNHQHHHHQSLPHSGHSGGPTIGIQMQQGTPSSASHHRNIQHSYPVLGVRRGHGRRLPPTPCKPSTLHLPSGTIINFSKINPSPHQQTQSAHSTPYYYSSSREREYRDNPSSYKESSQAAAPLSFEQGVALGRGGRMLPSPVPNGYKPKPNRSRHSDSDDDDWC